MKPGVDNALHERGEPRAVDQPQVEHRVTLCGDGTGDDVARRQLLDETVTLRVDEQRAVAAECLRQQQ